MKALASVMICPASSGLACAQRDGRDAGVHPSEELRDRREQGGAQRDGKGAHRAGEALPCDGRIERLALGEGGLNRAAALAQIGPDLAIIVHVEDQVRRADWACMSSTTKPSFDKSPPVAFG
jgi:hypothetical protein